MSGTVIGPTQNSSTQSFSAFLKLSRYIGRNMPALRGKNLILRKGLAKLMRGLPTNVTIVTVDGLSFAHCNLNQYIYRELFVYGVWETDVKWIYDRLLRPGDTVLDVGACFGYHALRAAMLVGRHGRVFAIEPQADIHANLLENIHLNCLSNVHAECLAMTATGGAIELHRFANLDVGNTSISTLDHAEVEYETLQCRAVTLDQYVADATLRQIDLIKLDVEGAELSVLQGASELLRSLRPPMWVLEINEETARSCGYHPRDLLKLLAANGYSFFRPVRGNIIRRITRLEKCNEGRHGDNLLCAVPDVHRDRLQLAGVL